MIFHRPAFSDDDFRVTRTCPVYSEPKLSADEVCVARSGATPLNVTKGENGFMEIELEGNCTGFIPDSCVGLPDWNRRKGNIKADKDWIARWQMALQANADLLSTTVASSTESELGFGFGASVRVDVPIFRRWRVSPTVGYLEWHPRRTVGASGSSDPLEAPGSVYTQSISYLRLGSFISVALDSGSMEGQLNPKSIPPTFWIEVGLEKQIPLSASQSLNGGAPTSFSSTDSPMVGLIGVQGAFPVTRGWGFTASVLGFYNLASAAGSSVMGARTELAFSFGLL